MVITKKYAKHLIKNGKAEYIGIVIVQGKSFATLNRFDLARTDHYLI